MAYSSEYSGSDLDLAVNNILNMWIILSVAGVDSNSIVTVELNEYNLEATANSSGIATFNIPAYGSWKVSGKVNNVDLSSNITIIQVKPYSIDLSI